MGLLTRAIPSMFHRRLFLMAAAVAIGFAGLSARLGWVTLVRGENARDRAERRLVRETWLPTVRGSVLDRHGRVLAQDRPSYDIAVSYEVLSGAWAPRAAERFARRAHRDSWGTLDRAGRDKLVSRYLPAYERRVDQMWSLVAQGTGVDLAVIEASREDVRARIDRMQADVTARRRASERAKLEAAGIEVGEDELSRIERIAGSPIAEKLSAHAVVRGVSDQVGFRFMRLVERTVPLFSAQRVGEAALDEAPALLPGVEVIDATARVYPFERVRVEIDGASLPSPIRSDGARQIEVRDLGGFILGRVRRGFYREDVERRERALDAFPALRERSVMPNGTDRGRYFPGDRVGQGGVEAAFEDRLRGLRGLKTENLQTRAVAQRSPVPGRDLELTIDIQLQARVRAILDPELGLARVQGWHENEKLPLGTDLDAAAVVLDVATGEILAMVSTPVPPRDGDWGVAGLEGAALERFEEVRTPYVNRAIGKPYPPGSIAKALILTGAATHGVYTPGERIPATGHYFEHQPNAFRSWIYKQHGITHADQLGRDPDGVDALMVSANVFFYTLGDRLAPEGIARVYREFGIGEAIGLGLGGEWAGSIGAFDGPGDGTDLTRQDAILLGIGQGPVTWTPLRGADTYATIARGGIRITPKLVRDDRAPEVVDLGLDSDAVWDTLDGLDRAANDSDYGTGYDFATETGRDPVFTTPGIRIWGKTGTATAPAVVIDPDDDGPLPAEVALEGDHSWYVVLCGEDGGTPRYAIAVVVDYGGSGGRVSGPITNQIVRALVEEGYLRSSGISGVRP